MVQICFVGNESYHSSFECHDKDESSSNGPDALTGKLEGHCCSGFSLDIKAPGGLVDPSRFNLESGLL